MKILWLTPLFPYPLYSGGQIRAYHLLKGLSKKAEITLFSFWRPNREQGPVSELEKYCKKVLVFPGRKTWTIRNVALSGFSSLPFTVSHFWGNRRLQKEIHQELRSGKYDLVHHESFYTTPYLFPNPSVKTVLGNENVEHRLYRLYAQNKPHPLKSALLYDVQKLKRFEKSAWKKADLNLAVSSQDAAVIEKASGKKCVVIPNGVDPNYFGSIKITKPVEDRPDFLFVGDFKYFANKDALTYLIGEIWPKISHRLPRSKLWLVGKNPGRFAESLKGKNIIVDSTVKDIRQVYGRADLMLVPLRIGSGTSLKILEAMACGLPIVSTSLGVRGLGIKSGREAILADDPEKFAEAAVGLINNDRKRKSLGEAGKRLINEKYSWDKISKKLFETYQRLIQDEN